MLRDAFASLGPAAVLTVHRSQGSTFGEVFVAADVFWPKDEILRRQLVYVAVSRASQAVTLMGEAGSERDGALWQEWLRDPQPQADEIEPGSRASIPSQAVDR